MLPVAGSVTVTVCARAPGMTVGVCHVPTISPARAEVTLLNATTAAAKPDRKRRKIRARCCPIYVPSLEMIPLGGRTRSITCAHLCTSNGLFHGHELGSATRHRRQRVGYELHVLLAEERAEAEACRAAALRG